MIVKMKFLSISGPRTDIDRVSASYLSKYEMQLENAITELKTTDNLMPFMDVNPYKEPLSKAEQYVLMLAQPKGEMDTSLTADEILTMIRDLNHDYLDLKAREDRLKKQKEELLEKLHELEPFQPLELNLKEVYGYQYMKVRFGRVNVEYYQKLEKYLFDDLNAIFLEGIRNENYVYGCYFAAHKEMGKIDSTFKSLHFENIALPDDYEGMPAEICRNLRNQIDEIEKEIENVRRLLNCSCFSFLSRPYMYDSMKRILRSLSQVNRLSVHSVKSSQFDIGILLEHLIKRCFLGSFVRLQQFVSCQSCNS